jgi:hypothetical protein
VSICAQKTYLQDFEKDPMPYKAYESVHKAQQEGTNVQVENKDVTIEKTTENIVRSKRSSDEEEETAFISFSDHEAVTSTIYIWA